MGALPRSKADASGQRRHVTRVAKRRHAQAPIARRTRSRLSGKSRTRTPVASATALAIAAAAGPWPASPVPRNLSFGRLMTWTSTVGTAGNRRIGYVPQSRLVISSVENRQRDSPGACRDVGHMAHDVSLQRPVGPQQAICRGPATALQLGGTFSSVAEPRRTESRQGRPISRGGRSRSRRRQSSSYPSSHQTHASLHCRHQPVPRSAPAA